MSLMAKEGKTNLGKGLGGEYSMLLTHIQYLLHAPQFKKANNNFKNVPCL